MNRFSSNESDERSSNHNIDIDALCVCACLLCEPYDEQFIKGEKIGAIARKNQQRETKPKFSKCYKNIEIKTNTVQC